MAICPSCGEENPDRFRLCGFCGTPLHAAEPRARDPKDGHDRVLGPRRVDRASASGSTPSRSARSCRATSTSCASELERHGGTVEKFIGDAVMAVFGLPHLHEDDAERAVRAAAGMQAALAGLNAELDARFGVTLQNRTGVNTGEVVVGRPGRRPAARHRRRRQRRRPARAGRRHQRGADRPAHPRPRARAVADLEPVEPLALKGKSEPMPAFRLMGVRAASRRAPLRPRRSSAGPRSSRPLRGELDAAVASGSARLVKIVAGGAGAGKSRLVAEFLGTVPDGDDRHARPLPLVRPGDHLLAHRGGRFASSRACCDDDPLDARPGEARRARGAATRPPPSARRRRSA